MASQITALLAFVRGIHRSPVNSPHKGPVTRKMFPFDDVIMNVMDGSVRLHLEYSETVSFNKTYFRLCLEATLCA